MSNWREIREREAIKADYWGDRVSAGLLYWTVNCAPPLHWTRNAAHHARIVQAIDEAMEGERKRCVAWIKDYIRAYPEDIFPPPPPGQHGRTVDACSASALRFGLKALLKDIESGKAVGDE